MASEQSVDHRWCYRNPWNSLFVLVVLGRICCGQQGANLDSSRHSECVTPDLCDLSTAEVTFCLSVLPGDTLCCYCASTLHIHLDEYSVETDWSFSHLRRPRPFLA